ncbi:hypothetical protein HA402_001625 [Bradysia odoriphaga]|nr:hypothetical protein HA402_001625 [Bradysia odoriphaga]
MFEYRVRCLFLSVFISGILVNGADSTSKEFDDWCSNKTGTIRENVKITAFVVMDGPSDKIVSIAVDNSKDTLLQIKFENVDSTRSLNDKNENILKLIETAMRANLLKAPVDLCIFQNDWTIGILLK